MDVTFVSNTLGVTKMFAVDKLRTVYMNCIHWV